MVNEMVVRLDSACRPPAACGDHLRKRETISGEGDFPNEKYLIDKGNDLRLFEACWEIVWLNLSP
jgi:hypothetical protein